MKKDILFVTNTFNSGGIGKYLQKIIPTLHNSNIFILSRDNISENDKKKYNISKCFNVKIPKYLSFWPLKEIIFFLYGLDFFKDKKFDVVFCNYPLFIPKKMRKDSVIIQVFHSLHKQYFNSSTPKRMIFLFLKICHFFLSLLDNWRIKNASKIVCISNDCFNLINKKEKFLYPNYPEKKILYELSKKKNNQINVLFVGRDDPFKGKDLFEKLISTINKEGYKNIKFKIVGSNKLKKKYPNVSLEGFLTFEETMNAFSNSDIFISTSYIENMPNVIWEALEKNVIPLVSDVGDCKKMVYSKEFFFKSNNFDDLYKKFKFIIKNLSKNRIKLKSIISKINKKTSTKDLSNLYNE
jgi:hypothetical protein